LTGVTRPRLLLAEAWAEARLTGRKLLIVEGNSDRRFFNVWFDRVRRAESAAGLPLVVTAEELEIDPQVLFDYSLNDGARSRVIYAAMQDSRGRADVKCIADRDCGLDIYLFESPTQLWTDFPALESYAFCRDVMDFANSMHFREKLPAGQMIIDALAPALALLFSLRVHFPDGPSPKVSDGFRQRDSNRFDLALAVEPTAREAASKIVAPSYSDAREIAYGHDIADAMLAVWANSLKNNADIRSRQALERVLLSSVLGESTFEHLPLFQTLKNWVLTP
jgi:hypothetical protein